jgi:hypothetical protein
MTPSEIDTAIFRLVAQVWHKREEVNKGRELERKEDKVKQRRTTGTNDVKI